MAIDWEKWEKERQRLQEKVTRQIRAIYRQAAQEAAAIGGGVRMWDDTAQLFSFKKFPLTKKSADKLISDLSDELYVAIVDGVSSAWTLADSMDSELCHVVLGDNLSSLTEAQRGHYFKNTDKALEAFLARKTAGLSLSDRVWAYTKQYKTEIELALDVGIRAGRSAAEMTKDLRQYLRYPDRLYRRVRDAHGNLKASKAMAAFHPGAGVYRSSYKNALRLSATETNMAYRTADYERQRTMDFVVGRRIVLSNNHTIEDSKGKRVPLEDICDLLSAPQGATYAHGRGCYPKDFLFTGWHPFCRCHAEAILKTTAEMAEDARRMARGEEPLEESVNTVKDYPEEFTRWVEENEERIEKWQKNGKAPYFIRDNSKAVMGVLKPKKLTPQEIAAKRHAARTPEQEADIKKRWEQRQRRIKIEKQKENKKKAGAIDRVAQPETVKKIDRLVKEREDKLIKAGVYTREEMERFTKGMKKMFDKFDYAMAIDPELLSKCMKEHFKNQFETGTSGGFLDKRIRKRASEKMFGVGRLKAQDYEKYGFLVEKDLKVSYANDNMYALNYGNAIVRFKKDKVIATWTVDDSLCLQYQPSLTTRPSLASQFPEDAIDKISDHKKYRVQKNWQKSKNVGTLKERLHDGSTYIELQYHGELTFDAVESVTFSMWDLTYLDSIDESLVKSLKKRGIKVYYFARVEGKTLKL